MRHDGTLSVEGRRFELPARYRHLDRVSVRYARWDLSAVDLVDPHTGAILTALYPLDKHRNADGQRRRLDAELPEAGAGPTAVPPSPAIAPLLRQLMADYAATGLPPAHLPLRQPEEEPLP